ncbi:MAG TPA: carbon-nitrogen hydrolase [Chlorobaculum sp.]|uniref:Carbon-nitrogen hydrolase family protein n=1 Tax=Chlorobaculum tepidum (strain ATCC 49652 / DSM 12025 / NBRC 103806 / TLS) TaxID=194439 RepID=Q8KFP8_CHLTE|nr:nitrilase-related carbon-nitrogen hydrolase [Chlorobaculum tepidum]AAM71520.1 carbon-nitrogen hydrolase family protein [Chlorobaculum tepidum TLS]HBU23748.1 carbon-nitrogen hydrolase [Chlorobaculum sp.]
MIRLATVQFTPRLGERQANLEAIRSLLDPVEADIVVLPELCSSGYFFTSREELAPFAESPGGVACSFFQGLADAKRAIIIAGMPETAQGCFYNSVFVFRPGVADPLVYRKSHLFYKERFVFEPGDTGFPVIRDEQLDISIGIMLCYDWRFPEVSRVLALGGADLIACPSNLVTDAWRKVMPARAIENKLYVAVANRCGTETRGDETLLFKGCSAVYDPYGETVALADADNDRVLLAEIDPRSCRDKSFNEFNDIFADRRPELYGAICCPRR